MFKLKDHTKDDANIVAFTENYGPVKVVNHIESEGEVIFTPQEVEAEGTDITVNNTYNDHLELTVYGKSTQEVHNASLNLLDFAALSPASGVTIDTENLTITTDGSSGTIRLAWSGGQKVANLHLSNAITMKCSAKILDDCTVTSGTFDLRIYDTTKSKTLAIAGGSAPANSVYTAKQVVTMSRTTSATTYYTDGDDVIFVVYVPLTDDGYMKVEFSNIMVSTSNVDYEPYRAATPAPDNPSPICATEGTITVNSSIHRPHTPVTVNFPGLHGLEQMDDAANYEYMDSNGKKFVGDCVVKTRELVDGKYVDKVYKTEKYALESITSNNVWGTSYYDSDGFFFTTLNKKIGITNVICTHFLNQNRDSAATEKGNNVVNGVATNQDVKFFPSADICANFDGWKAFLDAQEVAGTPVQVLYELAEPVTTDITNTNEGQAILALKTIPYCTNIYSDYHVKTKIRSWDNTTDLTASWSGIVRAVRGGTAPQLLPVGTELNVYDADTQTSIVFVVRGHDHHKPANSDLTHSMTLETKYVYSSASGVYKALQFDAQEAIYYAAEELPAGTYNFTWNYATGIMVNGTYQFTLTQAVPAGGQIVLGTTTSCKVSTYANTGATEAIESGITVTAGSDGTSLGTMQNYASTSENLNCCQRVMWGSNNYAQSAVRQWLNCDATAGAVWAPTNKFDRVPLWAATYNGFMHGLPASFLAAVQPATIPCRTNSYFEVASLDGTAFAPSQVYNVQDKFFLLSRPELYGTWDSTRYKDGELLDYYDDLTDTEHIKYDAAGSARTCWLRSTNPGNAYYERIVSTSGALSVSSAYSSYGVAPACIIA